MGDGIGWAERGPDPVALEHALLSLDSPTRAPWLRSFEKAGWFLWAGDRGRGVVRLPLERESLQQEVFFFFSILKLFKFCSHSTLFIILQIVRFLFPSLAINLRTSQCTIFTPNGKKK